VPNSPMRSAANWTASWKRWLGRRGCAFAPVHGAKLATGDVEQLNEYNIATEVFGRSATTFRTAEDAIAGQTHRLRKCLATFYEREGRDNRPSDPSRQKLRSGLPS